MNLSLKKHGFNIDELDNMIPYERDAYIVLIEADLIERRKKRQQQSNQVDIA